MINLSNVFLCALHALRFIGVLGTGSAVNYSGAGQKKVKPQRKKKVLSFAKV